MKCKYCQAELEEGVTLCPACGKKMIIEEKNEETAYCISKIGEERNTNGDFHISSNNFGKCDPLEEFISSAHSAAELVKEDEGNSVAETQETAATEAEETAAPEIKEGIKATPGKIALAIAAGVVVLALLVAMILSGIDGDLYKPVKEETAAPTEAIAETQAALTVVEGDIPADGNPDDVTCKGSYSVTDEELNTAMNTVVATMGDEKMTIGDLQVYYWEAIYAFDSNYGSYAAQLGLNPAGNMDRQLCAIGDISMTWQQYFLDYALNTWHTHQAVALAGKDAGYELEEIYQTELDAIPDQINEMIEYYGLTDAEQWIQEYIGPGCTVEDYLDYIETYYRGYGYLDQLEKGMTFTADEVEAYYAKNEQLYAQNGLTKDAGKTIDVRHILLMPENGTTGTDGYPVYSEEDWAACEAEVQKIYDEWMAGDKSEESFADFAAKYSQDGNAAQGGIYEDVTEGYMVPAFNDWCFDETRQFGDHGLVKTEYGYHIMFFVGSQDIWYGTAEADLLSETISAVLPAAKEKYPMTVDYSAIKLGVMAPIEE